MKKILLILLVVTLTFSCGGGNKPNISAIDNNSGNTSGGDTNNGGNSGGNTGGGSTGGGNTGGGSTGGGNTGGGSTGGGNTGGGSLTGGNDTSCTDTSTSTSTGWLLPVDEVKDGGPGKDGIPSIDNPTFTDVSGIDSNVLKDDDLVMGIVKNGEVKAYPYPIMNWHEIVNDKFNGESVTINYCPLTGTAFAWNSESNGSPTTFGVSGLLYNNNLILYDRSTDTNWSQLKLQAVNGSLIGQKPTLNNVIETNWKTWKTLYPNTKVLSTNTGFDRRYSVYPYGDYKTNQNLFLFAVNPLNNNLPHKERVYAIIACTTSKVYRFQNFTNGKVIKETFEGVNYLVVGNENLINSFVLNDNQKDLKFTFSFNNSETFFTDDEGNNWNAFGTAISGPRTGEVIESAKSVVSYWFAIAAFYPNPVISTD
jgi:hypothetical protein